MTWVDLSTAFGYGTKLTSTQMQNLRDNIAAAFAKDSGAPTLANDYITNDMIGYQVVDTTEIATAAIVSAKIDNGAIIAGKIDSGAVNADSIASGAVEQDALGDGIMTGGYQEETSLIGTKTEVYRQYFYHDGTAGTLTFRYITKVGSSGTSTVYIEANSTEDSKSTTSTSYVTKTGTISLSGLASGWSEIIVSLALNGAGGAFIKNFFWYVN